MWGRAVSRPALVVGLTGGIGSGKSAAAECFAQLGARVIDTDAIAHQLTGPGGAAIAAIRAAFGDAVITAEGALDRAAMRARVFAKSDQRARLEAILHPMIRERALQSLGGTTEPYAILMVPLLVETGAYRNHIDRVVVVDCAEAQQIERASARSGLDQAAVRAIMNAQVSRQKRRAAADDVIDNSGDLAHLHQSVAALHQKYLELARKR